MSKPDEIIKPIEWLRGRWTTKNGQGKYPTISDFSYHETLEFVFIGQPMLNFSSHSTHPVKNTPMHQERGFLRIKPGTNQVSLVVSHNFGLTTVEEGVVDPEAKVMELTTASVSRMSFAKSPHVNNVKRTLRLLEDGSLEMFICMETDRTDMTEHLRAVYKRDGD